MAKTLAMVFGIVFVLVGLLGFVQNPVLGLFEVNAAHNVVHLLIGIILVAVALWAPMQSSLWLKIVGVVYLLVALLGFFTSSPLLGLVEVNDADNWLHVVLAVVLIAAGFMGRGDMMAMNSMPMQGGQKM